MKIKVTMVYTYEVDPQYYTATDALGMANEDAEGDLIGVIANAEDSEVVSAEFEED